jgi:hypothetical protein
MDRERLGPGNTYQEGTAEVREGCKAEALVNCHDTGARHNIILLLKAYRVVMLMLDPSGEPNAVMSDLTHNHWFYVLIAGQV